MNPKITFLLTGGTIDKEYDALDRAFTIGQDAVGRILGFVNPNFEIEIIPLIKKVSTDVTETDKEKIRQTCVENGNDKIVITYGTDAMAEIGKVLKDINDKTIVITGALKSQLIKDTDTEFNLGFAAAAVQAMPSGIYIAMSGRIYPWNKCKKNMTNGQFVQTE